MLPLVKVYSLLASKLLENFCEAVLGILLLLRCSGRLKSLPHLLERRIIDFATGIALTKDLECGELSWGRCGLRADQRRVSPAEPTEERPGKSHEHSNPDDCPKQVHQRPKSQFLSHHDMISFISLGMLLTDILSFGCHDLFVGAGVVHRSITHHLCRRSSLSRDSYSRPLTSRSRLDIWYPTCIKKYAHTCKKSVKSCHAYFEEIGEQRALFCVIEKG
jgi:hypothetical protein